jgi:predicted AlkP superfamily pyrophosphatase or phosphodiesterase
MLLRSHQGFPAQSHPNSGLHSGSKTNTPFHTPWLIALLFASWGVACSTPAAAQTERHSEQNKHHPKLILQIVVDQLREDMLSRMASRFGEGGFRYLMDNGVWYIDASHPHADTETAVGHTVLATGAYPSRSGIIGNSWINPKTGQKQDCVLDPNYPLIGTTQEGSAPVQILTTTFSDEMALATNGNSHIFAVSEKDRAAIPLAGHYGKAFWFNTNNGQFNTSTYYYSQYPAWVTAWNAQGLADTWQNKIWEPLDNPSTYLYEHNGPYADNVLNFGAQFPHPFGNLQNNNPPATFYVKLTVSYVGNELTTNFAKALIQNEQLGTHDGTDYLGVSYSSTDFVDHIFSPDVMESEDVLRRLDRSLADLLAYVDKTVGLKNTLIVFAADHGSADVPEYLKQIPHIPTGRVDPKVLFANVDAALVEKYHVPGLLWPLDLPYLYLDHKLIAQHQLNLAEVQRTAADAAMSIEGIYLALPSATALTNGAQSDAQMLERIQRMQNPERAGDLYIVQQPQWQLDEKPARGEPGSIVNHGSPWEYDTSVPVIFAGYGLKHSIITRPISTTDVAVTLSGELSIGYPSGTAGRVLPEIVPFDTTCTATDQAACH